MSEKALNAAAAVVGAGDAERSRIISGLKQVAQSLGGVVNRFKVYREEGWLGHGALAES